MGDWEVVPTETAGAVVVWPWLDVVEEEVVDVEEEWCCEVNSRCIMLTVYWCS